MRFYPYFDTHCDTMLKMFSDKLSLNDASLMVNLESMKKYRFPVQVFALFNEGNLREADIMKIFSFFKKECAGLWRHISIEKTSRGIRQNFHRKRATAILAIEGLGNQKDFSLKSVECYHKIGVRFISLCWNGDNILCGGSDANKTGLTPLGKQTLAFMEKKKIILDTSHMSDTSFWEASECYSLPMCATHSASRRLCNHPRNLTDEQFRELVKRGGVCGINTYPPFLGGENPGISQVIAHIEHFLSLGGEDAIGIGADFDGIDQTACGLDNSAHIYKLFNALLSLNYKEMVVNKIAFYNFYKFFSKFEI